MLGPRPPPPIISCAGDDASKASLAVIGSWSRTVSLLALPSLKPVTQVELGSEVIPRSVALADFDGQPYVLCGLGDGQLHNWRLEPGKAAMNGAPLVSGQRARAGVLEWLPRFTVERVCRDQH
jgi:DNA damage-binding protein 1